MKLSFLMLLTLFYSFSNAADSLMDALIEGNFTHQVNSAYENADVDENKRIAKNKTVTVDYKTAPINGLRFEVSTENENTNLKSYSTKALYNGELSYFDYTLSANNNMTNAKTYEMDINFSPKRDLTLGSRYTLSTDEYNVVSYTGVYSSFMLNEIDKGLNIGLYYDKTGLDKKGDKVGIKIKNEF